MLSLKQEARMNYPVSIRELLKADDARGLNVLTITHFLPILQWEIYNTTVSYTILVASGIRCELGKGAESREQSARGILFRVYRAGTGKP
jgi:hypothetical protein